MRSGRRRLLLASQPLTAGVPRHVLDLVECLDPERYDLQVACPQESLLWKALAGRPVASLHRIPPAARPTVADAAALRRLVLLARQADLVHVHSSKLGFLGRLAARLSGQGKVCLFTPHAWSFWALSGPAARVCEQLERRAARWCARIITVSEDERRVGLGKGIGEPAQYRVVRNGIDLSRFSGEPQPVPGRVLVFCRAGSQKRVDLALRAVERVARARPEVELLLLGEDTEAGGAIARLVGDLDGTVRTRLLGIRTDVPELLARAACVLVTSDYEGTPLAVMEAMAAGVPVVATRVGGTPDLIEDGHNGILFERGSVDAAAAALERVLGDRERAQRLGEAAREHAHRSFSRQRMTTEIARVYDELVNPRLPETG